MGKEEIEEEEEEEDRRRGVEKEVEESLRFKQRETTVHREWNVK